MGRKAAPIGTVRVHKTCGQQYRQIKVLGPDGLPRWRLYSVHLWEVHHGPVPSGYLVLHEDGNTLNDDPQNLILGSRGDSLFLALERERIAEKRRLRVVKANRLKNREMAQIRRSFYILDSLWYLVIHPKRFIYPVPYDRRSELAAGLGLPVARSALRSVIDAGVVPTLGRDVPREGYARVAVTEVWAALTELLPSFSMPAAIPA